jgi:hypothetical protein
MVLYQYTLRGSTAAAADDDDDFDDIDLDTVNSGR